MTTKIQVQNLKCGGCAHTIKTRLLELPGITHVEADSELSEVELGYSEEQDMALVIAKLKTLGYPINDEENGVLTKAKSFVSCAVGRFGS